MSKCQICAAPGTGTILLKVQWFGRGTKWLCMHCVRSGAAQAKEVAGPHQRRIPPTSAEVAGQRKLPVP